MPLLVTRASSLDASGTALLPDKALSPNTPPQLRSSTANTSGGAASPPSTATIISSSGSLGCSSASASPHPDAAEDVSLSPSAASTTSSSAEKRSPRSAEMTNVPDVPANPAIAGAPGNRSSAENDVNAPYGLSQAERNWSALYPTLEAKGYRLRPRYRPGWVGSWVGTSKRPSNCEDSIALKGPGIVMDAVRMSDGRQVLLKLWSDNNRDGPERGALQYFSDQLRRQDHGNHVVPLLDVLIFPEWKKAFGAVLVEPLLRPWNEPPFVMVAEGLDFVLQLLEGLEYMHSHHVAHGDIHSGNIMMDAEPIYHDPNGFHAASAPTHHKRVFERLMNHRRRLAPPVKYYLIDLGSSSMFPSFAERSKTFAGWALWQPPEWRSHPDQLMDPFKADVYALALTLVNELQDRPGLHFVIPIFERAMVDDPVARCTAAELKEDFLNLLATVKVSYVRQRIGWSKEEHPFYIPPTLWERARDYRQYIRVLVYSYVYGLSKEISFNLNGANETALHHMCTSR